MKRVLVGLVIGLLLLEVGRRLYHPAEEAAAAGAAAYRAGDYTTAEARFHEAEREAPDKPLAAYNRGAALYRLRRFDDADHSYQRSEDGEALRDARGDYDRGNCDFSDACKDENAADPELLRRAARQYETCLAREGSVPEPGSLFDDARHNLELTRLILSEFAEKDKPAAEADKPESTANKDDPFAPANAAHPPEGADGQSAQANGGAQPDHKENDPKPSESLAKNDPNKPQAHPCKECERGGCPKCKNKPGPLPGPQPSTQPGDGKTPTPGKADDGKSPGKGQSEQEADSNVPGKGKKGKPGEGGKPNPKEKNGLGHGTEKGDGPVDESFKSTLTGAPSEGKMVGPDGVLYERKDQKKEDKPSQGKKGGGGDGPADEVKDPQPGGKNGTAPGLPGAGDPRANDGTASGHGGMLPGPAARGYDMPGREADDSDGSGDPRERAAARRLHQAVQRIDKARQSRPAPAPAKGEAPDPARRRDW
jgi:hypothetical protein